VRITPFVPLGRCTACLPEFYFCPDILPLFPLIFNHNSKNCHFHLLTPRHFYFLLLSPFFMVSGLSIIRSHFSIVFVSDTSLVVVVFLSLVVLFVTCFFFAAFFHFFAIATIPQNGSCNISIAVILLTFILDSLAYRLHKNLHNNRLGIAD